MKYLLLATCMLTLSGCGTTFDELHGLLPKFTSQQPIAVYGAKTKMTASNETFEVTGTDSCPKSAALAILPDFRFCTVILPDTANVVAYVTPEHGQEATKSETLVVQKQGNVISFKRSDGTALTPTLTKVQK